MMALRWITRVWPLLLAVVGIVQTVRWHRHRVGSTIPQQLVELVQQAHKGETFTTQMDIQVSPEMRDALCLPLTPQQLETMRAAGEGVYSRSVFCRLVSSRYIGGELSGEVWVSVKVRSRYSKNDLLFPGTELRIVVRNNGRKYPMEAWRSCQLRKLHKSAANRPFSREAAFFYAFHGINRTQVACIIRFFFHKVLQQFAFGCIITEEYCP